MGPYLAARCAKRAVRRHSDAVEVTFVSEVVRLQLAVRQVPNLLHHKQRTTSKLTTDQNKDHSRWSKADRNTPWPSCPIHMTQWWGFECWARTERTMPNRRGHPRWWCTCTRRACSTAWRFCRVNRKRFGGCRQRKRRWEHPSCGRWTVVHNHH